MSFNFDEFLESLKEAPGYVKENDMSGEELNLPKIKYSAEFESPQKAKDFHVELPEMLPKFLEERTTSALTGINKHMMEQILAFARAGHHQRVYVVIEFAYTDKPGAVTWNQHLFGYGDRGIAFKLAKKLHETVQMYDFGGPL